MPRPLSPPVSDDFRGTSLNRSLWQVQGGGAGTATSVSGGTLNLTVPSGSQHDLFPGSENALRVVQTISNGNFEVESKFNTLGNATPGNFQDEGIVIQQNSSTFLRFDMYSDGSSIIVFSAAASGTAATQEVKQPVSSPTAPVWLRVRRTGPTYLFSYSLNGSSYTVAGSFDSLMPVAQAGVYVGNSGAAPAGMDRARRLFPPQRQHQPRDAFPATTSPGASLNAGTWSFVNPGGDASQSRDGIARGHQRSGHQQRHELARSERTNRQRAADHAERRQRRLQHRREVRLARSPSSSRRRGSSSSRTPPTSCTSISCATSSKTEFVVKTVGDGGTITDTDGDR